MTSEPIDAKFTATNTRCIQPATGGKKAKVANGIPTDLEVDALIKRFGTPEVGTIIEYDEVAKVLFLPRKAHRFTTITNAWRKKLYRDHNLLVDCLKNEGFRVLDSVGRIGHASWKSKAAVRQIVRASNIAADTDDKGLSEADKTLRRRLALQGATVKLALRTDKLTGDIGQTKRVRT